MSIKIKKKLASIYYIISIILIITSIYIINDAEKKVKNYEKHLQKIYDENYWEFSTKVDSNVTGQYDSNTKNIIIYTKNNYAWYIMEVAYHETAHYIWYEFLNDSLRNEYFNIFNESN